MARNPHITARLMLDIHKAGHAGVTVKELRAATGLHHGTVSGTLSVLHRDGDIDRLADIRRDGYRIYVAPCFVGLRATEAQGRG